MRRRLLKAILVLFLLSRALEVAAQPIVKVQAPGRRSPTTITVSGRVIDFDAQALSGVRVGIATVDGPEEWMPAGSVGRNGEFRFRARLTAGNYAIVAGLGPFKIDSQLIRVDRGRRNQSFNAVLRGDVRPWRAADSGLHYDVPSDLPQIRLLSNPDQLPPAPPPPPPPAPGPGWAPEKNQVRVFYATNRRLSPATNDAGPLSATVSFANEPDQLKFGYFDVGVTFMRATGFNPLSSDRYQFQTYSIQLYRDAAGFTTALAGDVAQKPTKEALLFIHGYNTPFADGIYRTAQFAVETGFRGVPIYFGWPGGDHWWEYPSASKQVAVAATELATVVKAIAATPGVTKLHIIAHSLGNSVLVDAIEKLAQDPSLRTQTIADLVMAAPDVITARFRQVSAAMTSLFQRRTVYVSDTDWALRVGSSFDQQQRIGRRTPMSIASGFDAIDATGAKDTIIGHSYFVETDTVANDIAALIVRGLSAAQRGLEQTLDNGAVVWRLQN
jgi:esterase/lipase superfamily enzyme